MARESLIFLASIAVALGLGFAISAIDPHGTIKGFFRALAFQQERTATVGAWVFLLLPYVVVQCIRSLIAGVSILGRLRPGLDPQASTHASKTIGSCINCGAEMGSRRYRCPSCGHLQWDRSAREVRTDSKPPTDRAIIRSVILILLALSTLMLWVSKDRIDTYTAKRVQFPGPESESTVANPDRLDNLLLDYFKGFPDERHAQEIVNLISEGDIGIHVVPTLGTKALASYSHRRKAILVSSALVESHGRIAAGHVERIAGIIIHEARHARNFLQAETLQSSEEELLAFADEAIFERNRAKLGRAPWLDEMNRRIAVDLCAPWWQCPLPESSLKILAERSNQIGGEDQIAVWEWMRIKALSRGWTSFREFIARTADEGKFSIYDDKDQVVAALETRLSLAPRLLMAAEADAGEDPISINFLRGAFDDMKRQREIWTSAQLLSKSRLYYRKALAESESEVTEAIKD